MITSISSTGFLLSWVDPPPEHHNGVIRNYSIIVRELNTDNSIQLVSQTTDQSFDSLHPNYNYSIQVAAVTVIAGPYSPEYYITTLSDGKPSPNHNEFLTDHPVFIFSSKWCTSELCCDGRQLKIFATCLGTPS